MSRPHTRGCRQEEGSLALHDGLREAGPPVGPPEAWLCLTKAAAPLPSTEHALSERS